MYPVPAPATARLLKDAPIYAGAQKVEMVTPTGALLITGYAQEFGPVPPMRVAQIGYGAGNRDFADMPNVLRVLIGEMDAAATSHTVVVIEAEIDDMAFQIVDDLLDFTGEEVALGKPVGGDLREGKMTLPVIHLRDKGDARANALLRKVVESRDVTLDEWREIRTLLTQSRSIDYARWKATEYVEFAKKALYAFPPSEARDALMYLPDYVISRDR